MTDYGSLKPKLATQCRFEQFMFDLAAKRRKRTSHDDALDALLKRAGY